MNGQRQTCALRALTLCDGNMVETPERIVTQCVCRHIELAEENGHDDLVRKAQYLLAELLSETAVPLGS